jgi:cytochrome c553
MAARQPKWQAKSRTRGPSAWSLRWAGALLLLALGSWALGPGPIPAEASPEKTAARAPSASLAQSGRADDLSPALRLALEREGDIARGQDAYSSCAVCHLTDGGGRSDGTFPRLAGQHATVIIKQLIDIREGRRLNPLMLPYAKRLIDAQEVADVALYVSRMPRLANNGKGTGSQLGLGAELYARDCATCHGVHGDGDAGRFIPALAGQHYGYMLRQIRDIGAGRRGNAHPVMAALAAKYSDAELMALVDHASRIRGGESRE